MPPAHTLAATALLPPAHRKESALFGLPMFTALAIFGITAVWIIYTAVFWVISRNWHLADEITEGEA